jgi:MFS family permease
MSLTASVWRVLRRAEYFELMALFFVQGAALGMWFVPLSTVLDAHGLHDFKPVAFAASAVAAFVSPLIFGAMADRHASPVKVLRALAFASAVSMTLACLSMQRGWGALTTLGLIQLYAFCSSPTWSIASTIVLARLSDAQREFGPVRAMATLGWMGGAVLVSVLGADASTLAGYGGAFGWLLVCGFTWFLPVVAAPSSGAARNWRERFGLDALSLLKNKDHRVVFLTCALFSVPLTAFYPYAPPHLQELGLQKTSAWMSLGQVTEIIAMFSLGALLGRGRLKWIFAAGLTFGVLRFALSALNVKLGLLAGVVLHGCSFTLVFITAQIYLEQRIDPAWRARAQALMSLMNSGVGSLVGYLGTGWWFQTCTNTAGTHWPIFWGGLSVAVILVMAYFLIAYRGRSNRQSAT